MENLYHMLAGLAYTRGLDSFETIMPRDRVYALHKACMETRSFRWFDDGGFIRLIICAAGREERALNRRPKCSSGCKYKMPYDTLSLQHNALRVEICTPADRCGWNLKSDRMGGRPDDYHPCTYRC